MVSKYSILILLSFFVVQLAWGQIPLEKLSLDKAYELLESRYPALKDGAILNEIHQKEQLKIDKNRLPEIFIKADGRLQSASPSLDLPPDSPLPFEIDLPLYSAKTYVEAQYNILDGGINAAQKKLQEVQLQTDLQAIEVSKYALRERVNQLFVNIAVLRAQNKLFEISLDDLGARKKNVTAGIEEGILLESELAKIQVKELEIRSQQANITYSLSGFVNSLELLLGTSLAEEIQLEFPDFPLPGRIASLNRPEQKLFTLQQQAIQANSDMIDASRRPKLGVYGQAGVGYPNPLNFLDNGAAPYGVIGFQFNWKITDWKRSKLNKEILNLQAQKVQHAKETFEFNLNTREAQYLAEVKRLQQLQKSDTEIADLQADILKQLAVQLDEGVITATEYIAQVNAELKARQNLLIHQTELLKLQVEFLNERGGLN